MNVLFCSLDTLRADHLTCLGDTRGLTPNLDRIASEGALFRETYATDIPTQPSHTAIFTGQFGINTGIVSHFHPSAQLDPETLWLPSLMRKQGYTTGAVDHLFAMKDWFIRGYDDYMPPPGRSRSPGSVINEIGLKWISEHKDEDFFLFLHFWDAHIPYVPPSPYKERFSYRSAGRLDPDISRQLKSRPSYPLFKQNLYDFLEAMPNVDYIADLYDAEVAYLDFEIGRIFAHLEREGLLEDTLVVLFGDHGENMTEHDAWFDHAGLYDSVVHVPLIMWAPGKIPAFETSTMVTLADILPTVLEVLDLPPAQGINGRSLMPLMRGETTVHRETVMLSESTWQAARAVRTPEWKLIKFYQATIYGRDGLELYNLKEDPTEQHNVAEEHPDITERMHNQLLHWVGAQLAGRPDPLLEVVDAGLPAVARLNGVMAAEAAALEAAAAAVVAEASDKGSSEPGPTPGPGPSGPGSSNGEGERVTQGAGGAGEAADASQIFAPAVAGVGRGRLRGRRGVFVGVLTAAAAALVGLTLNNVLLAAPVAAAGVVEPASSAQLNLAAAGPIASIDVRVGEYVKAGQVLASESTSAVHERLVADQAKLAADQATLVAEKSGGAGSRSSQLQAQVASAQVQLASAQAKVIQTTKTTNTTIASAQAQIASYQHLLDSDQQAYQAIVGQCASSSPPNVCTTDLRQIQVDQGNLTSAGNALQQAYANQQAQVTAAQAAVNQAQAAVSSAEAAVAAASAPASPSAISATEVAIERDQAAVAADESALSQAVLVAPFAGVVSAVNGTVGEIDSPQGVRQPTGASTVASTASSGIQIFPQGPQTQGPTSPQFASLISLNSLDTKIVVQVPEADLAAVRLNQQAEVTFPALPGRQVSARVTRIEATPVVSSGTTYYLVDLEGPAVANSSTTTSTQRATSVLASSEKVGFTANAVF